MAFSKEELKLLAIIINQHLQVEFYDKFLSGNLKNTIEIEDLGKEIRVHIPAEKYNMLQYQTKGVVIHNGRGSYASQLDEEGSSFMVYPLGTKKGSYKVSPRNHIGYIDKVIDESIREWRDRIKTKTEIKE